jgi:hypothetical protein
VLQNCRIAELPERRGNTNGFPVEVNGFVTPAAPPPPLAVGDEVPRFARCRLDGALTLHF